MHAAWWGEQSICVCGCEGANSGLVQQFDNRRSPYGGGELAQRLVRGLVGNLSPLKASPTFLIANRVACGRRGQGRQQGFPCDVQTSAMTTIAGDRIVYMYHNVMEKLYPWPQGCTKRSTSPALGPSHLRANTMLGLPEAICKPLHRADGL